MIEALRRLVDLGRKPRWNSRAVEVGWFLDTDKAGFIWDEPKRVKRDDPAPTHAKSVNHCPAALDHEARMFEVPCPIDARLRFKWGEKGEPLLINADGDHATIRPKHLGQMVAVVNRREWRHPERPIIQIVTPYVFVTDEPVYMTQMPPIGAYLPNPWPGILIGGRLPIHVWPRQMMWAFEWYDISKDLILKRGAPWFYLRFETYDPTRPIKMFEAEVSPELKAYVQGISSVSNYVNRTFSLFKTAQSRRPKRLLSRKTR
ncbi:MAG: hypothetical protein JWP35_4625 [Caulobacter sp.]|nr:hypothetical protein [Caulobacter sp.]